MVGPVVIAEKSKDERPAAAALNALRSQVRARHGLSAQQVNRITSGMTRAEIVAEMVAICRALPPGKVKQVETL